MKEEKVKEIKQNAESLKNANGDTVVKIAAEINKNENTTVKKRKVRKPQKRIALS